MKKFLTIAFLLLAYVSVRARFVTGAEARSNFSVALSAVAAPIVFVTNDDSIVHKAVHFFQQDVERVSYWSKKEFEDIDPLFHEKYLSSCSPETLHTTHLP